MSRAAQSKSRAEKKGGQSAPTPAVTHEIVPGKFNDVDWNRMLEFDDGEDFISDIVDELIDGTLGVIFQRYIEKQLLPYTISQAKEAILTIIDWRFLSCDSGEKDASSDPTWQEDEEPSPAVPDCWAQGSVPKTVASKPPSVTSIREESVSVIEHITTDTIEGPEELTIELEEQGKVWEVNVDDLLDGDDDDQKLESGEDKLLNLSTLPQKQAEQSKSKSKRAKFKPYKGRLKSAGVGAMTDTLEKAEHKSFIEEKQKEFQSQAQSTDKVQYNPMPQSVASILKLQGGRPPGSRDVYYDENGTVIAMAKISAEKLPSHSIKTKFHVVNPSVEAAQARLDAMRTGRYLAAKPKRKPQAPPSEKSKQQDKTSTLDYKSLNSQFTPRRNYIPPPAKSGNVTPLPPPMIESMELAPGVVVKEGERVKKGPRQTQRNSDKLPPQEALRPVGENITMKISVKDLLGNTAPVVRLMESTPVPPIVPKPPTQRRGIQT